MYLADEKWKKQVDSYKSTKDRIRISVKSCLSFLRNVTGYRGN